jgi:hypothetical protein
MAKSAELKTKVNEASVEGFLNSVKDEQTRADCFEILKTHEASYQGRTEDVGREHCRFWQLSLQRRQRTRRRLDVDLASPRANKT